MNVFFTYCYWGLLGIAFFIGIINYNRLTPPFRILTLLIFITLCNECLAIYMARVYRYNLILYHIYTPLHAVLVGIIYAKLLRKKENKWFVVIATITAVAFALVNTFFIQGINRYPHYDLIVISIFYVSYALLGNFEMIRFSRVQHLLRTSIFWLNSGILIFFSINFILWSLYDYLTRIKSPVMSDLFMILYVLNFVLYVFFALSIYFDSRRNKTI